MRKRKGVLGSPEPPILDTIFKTTGTLKDIPMCPACNLAKQLRRSTGSVTVQQVPENVGAIRRWATAPGELICCDQYVCGLPGRLPHTRGRESQAERYHGGTIFVDAYSSKIFIRNQVSLRTGETLLGKAEFEAYAAQFNVKLKSFRCDNHPFSSQEFLDDLALKEQTVTYCGVGAHHMNGVAERAIRTLVHWTRAIMMNQMLYWPEMFDEANWGLAMEHACWVWNNLPREDSRLTPEELFTGLKLPNHDTINNLRVWGCPAWVLHP